MSQIPSATSAVPAETHDWAVTSFLPVITPWPVPRNCSLVNESVLEGNPTFSLSSCQPDLFWSWWGTGGAQLSKTIWSLSPFQCPELYTIASLSSVATQQVEVVCCPT
jgi:hypothetical protein